MIPAEKMIIFYTLNLFLLNEFDNVENLISEAAFKVKGSMLYEANVKRIFALLQFSKTSIKKSLDQFKEVKGQYEKLHCKYGSALTNFSIGFIYRSKVSEFLIETDEETIYNNAKIHFEAALLDFIDLNHLTGEALCHKQLSHIQQKQNNKVSLNNS